MSEIKKYYVYEWIRLDTYEPFYVGKGYANRWCQLKRGNNNHFNNIVKSIPIAVHILHDNLNEQEALEYECWYIHEYKYISGYDITNLTDGGEGVAGYKATEDANKENRMRINGFDIEDCTDNIIDLYVNKNMTAIEIGKVLNTSKRPILRVLKKNNINLRSSCETNRYLTGVKRYNSQCIVIRDVLRNIVNCLGSKNECAKWLNEVGVVGKIGGGKKAIYSYLDTNINYKGLFFESCNRETYENIIANTSNFVKYELKEYNNNLNNTDVLEVYDIENNLVKTCYTILGCARWLVDKGLSNTYHTAKNAILRNVNNHKYYKNIYTFKKYSLDEYNIKMAI